MVIVYLEESMSRSIRKPAEQSRRRCACCRGEDCEYFQAGWRTCTNGERKLGEDAKNAKCWKLKRLGSTRNSMGRGYWGKSEEREVGDYIHKKLDHVIAA